MKLTLITLLPLAGLALARPVDKMASPPYPIGPYRPNIDCNHILFLPTSENGVDAAGSPPHYIGSAPNADCDRILPVAEAEKDALSHLSERAEEVDWRYGHFDWNITTYKDLERWCMDLQSQAMGDYYWEGPHTKAENLLDMYHSQASGPGYYDENGDGIVDEFEVNNYCVGKAARALGLLDIRETEVGDGNGRVG